MTHPRVFCCLIFGLFSLKAVSSDLCDRNEILPFLEFPYFRGHLHIGESMTCRFKSPPGLKADLRWNCMTPPLFDGIGKYTRNVAHLRLRRLQIPHVLYSFKSNWCSCRVRLHRIDGTTCERMAVQFFELFPPLKVTSRKLAKVSIGATRLSWLREDIVVTGCPSIHLCRDERYTQDATEDTKMVVKNKSFPLSNAIRPHPRIVFKSSFRYPFVVLDVCKVKKPGLYFYTCIHVDPNLGAGEKMFLNVTWTSRRKQIKKKPSDRKGHKPLLKNKTKTGIHGKLGIKSADRGQNRGKVSQSQKHPPVKSDQRNSGSKFSARYRKRQNLRKKLLAKYKGLQRMSLRLKRKQDKLSQTMIGIKIAVAGCVILALVSMAWFYYGFRMWRKSHQVEVPTESD